MLTIVVPGAEHFDDDKQEFFTVGDFTLELEHSLVALSKWESEFEKPFLGKEEKTDEEIFGYIRAMSMTPNVPPEVWFRLTEDNVEAINKYIDSKMTATWFNKTKETPSSERITSELIYYWMVVFQIPFECETWHLSRLFTLIKICNVKNEKPKKMNSSEAAAQRRELNAQRKAQLGTSG